MKKTVFFGSVAAGALLFSIVASPIASAAPSAAPTAPKPPKVGVTISGNLKAYAGSGATVTVTLRKLSKTNLVEVGWGDTPGARQLVPASCTIKAAKANSDRCSATLTYQYLSPGEHPLTVYVNRKAIYKQNITILPEPVWTPPEGWAQPSGWSLITNGASFSRCQPVMWYYDPALQPAESAGVKTDIASALALLAPQTGLEFVETSNPAEADMLYNWADIAATYGAEYGRAEAIGGPAGLNKGEVTFNTTATYRDDYWAGTGTVVKEWEDENGSWYLEMPGRAWLVVHETMHALGLGHVENETEVMNPVLVTAGFGPGDIDGLTTMYLNNPCPALS